MYDKPMMVHEWITLHTGFVFPDWFWGWQGTVLFYITILFCLMALINMVFGKDGE